MMSRFEFSDPELPTKYQREGILNLRLILEVKQNVFVRCMDYQEAFVDKVYQDQLMSKSGKS